MNGWETVVGLEVHVELSTATKMFCACATDFGGEPNTRVCAICAGMPGSLPVLNEAAVRAAVRLGLALGCTIAERCRFHRKNYFYPDLPKNYQISQYDVPLCTDGVLELDFGGETATVGIERLHMEEDTGKSLHVGDTGRLHGAERSLIDLNRSGIPLLEIVSRPDIRSAEVAQFYVRELQGIVRALGVSDARMEEGSMRCDANVSVRRAGDPTLGTRCEVKNLNSLRSLARAIAYEAERQVGLVEAGGEVVQETRHWDEGRGVTETLRRKEGITDYRYFPDPDLVDLVCTPEWVEELRASLPELPATSRARLVGDGVDRAQVATIVAGGLLPWYDEAVGSGVEPRAVANWLAGDVTAQLNARGLEPVESGFTGAHLAELVALVAAGTLSGTLAKEVLAGVFEAGGAATPTEVAETRGLRQISDIDELRAVVAGVVARNPEVVERVRGGTTKAIGALVGEVMRATGGQANPAVVHELLGEAVADLTA